MALSRGPRDLTEMRAYCAEMSMIPMPAESATPYKDK